MTCIYTDILYTALIGLPLLLVSWSVHYYLQSFKNLPAGPWALPFVGYTVFFGKNPHIVLTNLSKKYGQIYSVNIGTETVIVLSSYKVLKEAFVDQSGAFCDRTGFGNVKTAIIRQKSLIQIQNDSKRFTFSLLGGADFQKTVVEPQIINEVKCLMKTMESYEGKPQVMKGLIQKSTTNAMCAVLTGHRFEYKDDTLQDILNLLDQMWKTLQFPTWKKALSTTIAKVAGKTNEKSSSAKLIEIMSDIVEKYEKEYQSGSQNTFINIWLAEIEKQGMYVKNHLHREALKRVTTELLIGSYAGQANTLLWGLLFLMKHPEIQSKLQNEIDKIIGKHRVPTIADMEQMPYVGATILEIIRIRTTLSLHLSRCAMESTRVDGHFIQNEVSVVPNLWAVYHDPNNFPDPEKFKPERFLERRRGINTQNLINLSLAQPMAMMELFLYFTLLLQSFTLNKAPGSILDFDYDCGAPKTFRLCAVKR